MKKYSILLIFLICYNAILFSQNKQNDLIKLNLKGNVKSICEFEYEAIENFGELKKGNHSNLKYTEFNNLGYFKQINNKLLADDYENSVNGELQNDNKYISSFNSTYAKNKYTFEKDDKNNLISISEYDSDSTNNSNQLTKYILKYDVFGNIIENKTYKCYLNSEFDSTLVSSIIFKYDSLGNRTEESFFDEENKLIKKNTFKYKSKNNLIEFINYSYFGKMKIKVEYFHDIKGNIINEKKKDYSIPYEKNTSYKYNSKNRVIEEITDSQKFLYKLNDKGNVINKSFYDKNGTLERNFIYKYNIEGKLIEMDYLYATGELYNKILYSYDENSNLLTEKNTKDLYGYNYKYIYDKNKNWIEKIQFIGDVPKTIVTRDIIYF